MQHYIVGVPKIRVIHLLRVRLWGKTAITNHSLIQSPAPVMYAKGYATPQGMKSLGHRQETFQRNSECGLIYVLNVMRESTQGMRVI